MQKKCIGCKREISWGHKDCPFCGASQNILRQYIKSLVFIALILAGGGYLGYQYHLESIEKIRQTVKNESLEALAQSKAELQQLETQLAQVQTRLTEATDKITELQQVKSDNQSQVQQQLQDFKQKLAAAQKEAEKQQGRASWLGRENIRLKGELESLQEKLAQVKREALSQPPVDLSTDNQEPTEPEPEEDKTTDQ